MSFSCTCEDIVLHFGAFDDICQGGNVSSEAKQWACVCRGQEEEAMHPCWDVSSVRDGKSVIAAAAVSKSADVGLVDGVQERGVTLKNTPFC